MTGMQQQKLSRISCSLPMRLWQRIISGRKFPFFTGPMTIRIRTGCRKLATFINNFGYSIRLKDDEVHPKELQKLLAKLDGTPEEDLISRLTLRSMKRARYTYRLYRTFWTGSQVLLPLYFAYPPVSGSADSPDHQGLSPRTDERGKTAAL